MISKAEKFYKKEKYKQAEELCLQVLESEQRSVDALRLQSLIMLKTARIPQGIEFLKLALAQDPNNVESNIAMGLYCMALQKTPEAINAFLRAYQVDPTNTDALLYLGDLHSAQKEWNKAVVFYALYINLDQTNIFINQSYVNILSYCSFTQYSDIHSNTISHVLQDNGINVQKIFPHWRQILNNTHPNLVDSTATPILHMDALKNILNSSFFYKGVERIRIHDPNIEILLTDIRYTFLHDLANKQTIDLSKYKYFLFSLSMQCWRNEYVFNILDNETPLIDKLHLKIQEVFSSNNNSDLLKSLIYLYSCHKSPLTIDNILSIAKKITRNDKEFQHFFTIQIENHIEEEKIKSSIKNLTEIEDATSQAVQEMYEENPYPRGVDPIVFDKKLTEHTPYKILFAGCGTGVQILSLVQRYPNSIFTAIDLSLNSLSYAIRQTRKHLNISPKKIKYGQADILKIDQISECYDRIFCTGVLHHMEEPEKGLQALKNILSPQGIMRISLYSETARKEVVKAREYIEKNGYKAIPEDIRKFRHNILQEFQSSSPSSMANFLIRSPDFFTLSECRDLIFHVKEHRYTIPQIIKILNDNDLEFISFNINNHQDVEQFSKRFPSPNSELSPMKWHEYEQDHQYTFFGMYDFNVRHKTQ